MLKKNVKPVDNSKRLITTREAAEILGLSLNTLRQWVSKESNKLPFKPVRIGRAVRWSLPTINEYIDKANQDVNPRTMPNMQG